MKKLQIRSTKPKKKGIGKDASRRNYHCAPGQHVPINDQKAYEGMAALIILSIFKRKTVVGERQFRPLQYQTWWRDPDTGKHVRKMRDVAGL